MAWNADVVVDHIETGVAHMFVEGYSDEHGRCLVRATREGGKWVARDNVNDCELATGRSLAACAKALGKRYVGNDATVSIDKEF